MGLFSKDIKTMDDLLLHGLQISTIRKTRSPRLCPR